MADTYTPNLRLTKPEIGAYDDAWAEVLNDEVIQLAEDAIAGRADLSVTDGHVTLTTEDGAADQARMMFLRATGTPGASRNLVVPDVSKLYVVQNDANSNVVVTVDGMQGVTVEAGGVAMVFVADGLVYEVEIEPSGDVVTAPAAMQSLTLDVLGAGGGDTTVTAYYTVQGAFAYIIIESISATNFAGTTLQLQPTGGANWPSALVPASEKAFPVILFEDTGGGAALVPAELVISTAAGSPWSIRPLGGFALTAASDRQITHPITCTYATHGPAGTAITTETIVDLPLAIEASVEGATYDVEAQLQAVYPFGSAFWNRVVLSIDPALQLYPATVGDAAIDATGMDEDSGLVINIGAATEIRGRGGDGGDGGTYLTQNGAAGKAGGPAILLGCDTELLGEGIIAGGYGGGGGGGVAAAETGVVEYGGGGGGGGAAFGQGGTGGVSVTLNGDDGGAATFNERGAGGAGGSSFGGAGGDGGDDSSAAAVGTAGNSGEINGSGGAAGDDGKAVELNGFTLTTTDYGGTIEGEVS